MDTWNFAPISLRMWNTQLVQDDCQSQIVSVDICLMIFEGHMNFLLIFKVKILEDIKWW